MIPVVDFESLNIGVPEESVPAKCINSLAGEICDAFSTVGFVYLKNHGVLPEKIAKLTKCCREFFKQPTKVKTRFAIGTIGQYHGYVSLESENLNPEKNAADLKEAFNFGPEFLEKEFPPDQDVPFRKEVEEFFELCTILANRLLYLLAVGLNIEDKDFFKGAHKLIKRKGNATTLRCLYYPAINKSEVKEGQLRCGEHSDYGCITLLFQDDIGGLEVMNHAGEYVAAAPIPDTVLVNLGDMMQRWTGDKLLATKHRVIVPEGELLERQSFAFFVQPDDDYLISPIDGSDKYQPITSTDYLKMKFSKIYG